MITRNNNKIMKKRKRVDLFAHSLFFLSTIASIVVLFILIYDISSDGFGWLSKAFFQNFPSRFAAKSGIKPALIGSVWIIGLTALFSIPVGIGAAIYLEEYAKNNWFKKFIVINIANLAGVPSIVYGMLGLTIFVRALGFGRSILSGALTMSLLILPIIIVASQEAIRSVSDAIKAGSYALGATKWQTITKIIIPSALPGMLTGIIFAISRALGETAPLLMVGAFSYISTLPKGPMDSFVVLPIQIYMWAGRPQEDFRGIAAAGIIVLLVLLLTSNGIAIFLRNKYQVRSEE
ncbi:MAG: phosphate transporter, permease protein PstA [Clostridia bacterium]|jgi:phosphate transport system permease protein|nr:phosphate transporter, permease protein PstA [Clostridia bacterium]